MVSDLSTTFANSVFFLNSLTKTIDVFGDKYYNYLMGDFNLESGNTILTSFLDSNNVTNNFETTLLTTLKKRRNIIVSNKSMEPD